MLKLRVTTAIVLLAVLLPALFARVAWPFALVTLVLIAAAGWEWGQLNAAGPVLSWAMGALLAGLGVVAFTAGWTVAAPASVWWLAAAIWVIGGAWALRRGPSAWPKVPVAARWLIGVVGLFVAWLALSQARGWGVNFVLSVLALVWAADIAAYAGGRAFGKRKLAPTVSPGKTWEGALSGVTAVLLLGVLWMWIDKTWAVDSASVASRLMASFGVIGFVAGFVILSGLSVVGDLIESLVKRAAGAKDSSRLLPGHGGVLDRIDALLPVFPCALALVTLG